MQPLKPSNVKNQYDFCTSNIEMNKERNLMNT